MHAWSKSFGPILPLVAGLLFVISSANAGSPIVKPRAGGAFVAVPTPALPALEAGCKRALSEDYSAQVERPEGKGSDGGCAAAEKDERERRITQSELDCLMNGFEGSTEVRMACTRVTQRTPKGPVAALHFASLWRCYRSICPRTQ